MTKRELLAALVDVPDDSLVIIQKDCGGYEALPSIRTAHYDGQRGEEFAVRKAGTLPCIVLAR